MTAAALRRRLEAGAGLRRHPASRLAFVDRRGGDEGEVLLFVDGAVHRCAGSVADLGRLLCASTALPATDLARYRADDACVALLAELVNGGALAVG